MKLFFRNITLGLLIAFVLLASIGLSFSKISCSTDQQYVFGSEMPVCTQDVRHCCKKEKENFCSQNPKKENRKKETFHFKADFITYFIMAHELPKIISLDVFCESGCEKQGIKYSHLPYYTHYRSNPPPLLALTLPILQTFLI